MATDPFTTVSQTITAALSASTAFTSLVKPGNLIDMTTSQFAQFNQFKSDVQPGDLPEVVLLQANWGFSPFLGNSRTSSMRQDFHLIMTLDKLASVPLNQLKIAVMAALTKTGTVLGLDGLVAKWDVVGAVDDGMSNNFFKRNRIRFMSTMVVRVEMFINTLQLQQMA